MYFLIMFLLVLCVCVWRLCDVDLPVVVETLQQTDGPEGHTDNNSAENVNNKKKKICATNILS